MLTVAVMILVTVASSVATENCSKDGGERDCAGVTGATGGNFDQVTDWSRATSIYQFHARDIHGNDVSLENYRGHVLIVVNVASKCGLTKNNYEQLEALYEKYGAANGLRILAFPSNQFAGQEPGTPSEILDFVKTYNVQFDMFEKIDVNGEDAHPLWKWLQTQGEGFITNSIKWNFTKFVVDKNGQVVSRFAPSTEPFALEDTLKAQF